MARYTWFWRLGLGIAGLTLLFILTARASALQDNQSDLPTLADEIARDQQLIHAGQFEKIPVLDIGRLWVRLAIHYEQATEFAKSEDAYNHALAVLEQVPGAALEYAATLDNLGSLYLIQKNFDAAGKCRERAYAIHKKSGNALEIARAQWMLAEVDFGKKKYKDAQKKAAEAYMAMVAHNDPRVTERISVLMLLAYANCWNNQCAQGVESAREARALAVQYLPADHILLGEALMALGYTQWKSGTPSGPDGPDEAMREGIRILRERTAPGHPYMLGALTVYANYLRDVNRVAEANEVDEEQRMLKRNAVNVCSNCTVSVNGLRAR